MSVKEQIKVTLVPSKSIGLTKKPTAEPTVKPTKNYYKYYDAERYTMALDEDLIEYRNRPIEAVLEHIERIFDDKLVLVKSIVSKSSKNDYYMNWYKCKDGTFLIFTLERNRCIVCDWEK
jgi:hypothetical protein